MKNKNELTYADVETILIALDERAKKTRLITVIICGMAGMKKPPRHIIMKLTNVTVSFESCVHSFSECRNGPRAVRVEWPRRADEAGRK